VFVAAILEDYSASMPIWSARRYVTLTVAMLFGFSVVAHGFMAVDVNARMSASDVMDMSSTDMSKTCSGKDCGGNEGITKLACFAYCASSFAVLPVLELMPAEAAAPLLNVPEFHSLPGQYGSPDPYPPRPVILT